MGETIYSNGEIVRLLDQEAKRVIFELFFYTLWRLKLFKWLGGDLKAIAKGKNFQDYVKAIALEATNNGSQWDQRKFPRLIDWLKERVDLLTPFESIEAEDPDTIGGGTPDPEGIIGQKVFFQKLRELAEERRDKEVVQILDCVEAGIIKPGDIAIHTGMPIERVYNALKKLRRLAEELNQNGGRK